MKNALLLVGIWVGIILFAYGVVYLPGDRGTQVTLAGDVETTDSLHGIAFPLPAGWAFRPTDAAGVFVPPVAGLEAWAVSVPARTVDEALLAAWEAADPCSSCTVPAILESSPPSGARDGAVLVLAADAEGRTSRAVVLLLGDSARVLLSRRVGDLELPARVEEDITRIESGFRAIEVAWPEPATPPEPGAAASPVPEGTAPTASGSAASDLPPAPAPIAP